MVFVMFAVLVVLVVGLLTMHGFGAVGGVPTHTRVGLHQTNTFSSLSLDFWTKATGCPDVFERR